MTYADTSALLKLIVAEVESTALRAHLAGATAPLTSSELTIAELMRTSARLGAEAAAAAVLLSQIHLLSLRRDTLTRAGRLPSPPGTLLRTADAIHLAAALELGESEILTYDRRQAQAAARYGFDVTSPGSADDWFHGS